MGNPTSTYVWHFNKGFDLFFHIKGKFFSIWNLFDVGGGENQYIKFISKLIFFTIKNLTNFGFLAYELQTHANNEPFFLPIIFKKWSSL
jgi:hypothetical protein